MKQERYLIADGTDLIDTWAERLTHDEFRTVMFCQIEKYYTRLGKKDEAICEIEKMHDYMTRWREYEGRWVEQNRSEGTIQPGARDETQE